MNEYKFDWSGFTENEFVDYCAKAENNMISEDEFVGYCRVGDLCFDLVARDLGAGDLGLTFDLYVGGIDDGYGYSRIDNGYPYTEADGDYLTDSGISFSYEDFKDFAEGIFINYIEHSGYTNRMNLIEKANEPLHIW